jgi:tumor necrosis factor receptor superfamily protein 22
MGMHENDALPETYFILLWAADQEMVTNCSSTQNRVCQCQTGRFYQDLQDFEHCTPCSK